MADYRFVTVWRIPAPLEAVWNALYDAKRWPEWWPGLSGAIELSPGGQNGIGAARRFVWRGALPYTLAVDMRLTRAERPKLLESDASGELEGTGRWTLSEAPGGTAARYDWQVRTTKRWMNWFAPLARPLFSWNHNVVMRRGEAGLTRYLRGLGADG
jgi:uncharacterized protein YndB with AHSA1/START domain